MAKVGWGCPWMHKLLPVCRTQSILLKEVWKVICFCHPWCTEVPSVSSTTGIKTVQVSDVYARQSIFSQCWFSENFPLSFHPCDLLVLPFGGIKIFLKIFFLIKSVCLLFFRLKIFRFYLSYNSIFRSLTILFTFRSKILQVATISGYRILGIAWGVRL